MSRRAAGRAGGDGQDAATDGDHPRFTAAMIPQPAAEAAFARAYAAGRAAGSWMLEGPSGVGKASLAYRIARRLLAQGPGGGADAAEPPGLFGDPAPGPVPAVDGLDSDPDDPGVRKVRNGSHPDLLVIDPDTAGGAPEGDLAVDQIRRIGPFLHLTPALAAWRVVIVDEADRMNRNAANALLKLLEEPPDRAVMLVLAGRPGALPATIRSRCRRLRLAPLADAAVAALLADRRPALSDEDRRLIVSLAAGSPGRALQLADRDGAALWRDILDRLGDAPRLDWSAIDAVAERLGAKAGEGAFALWSELLVDALARVARHAASADGAVPPPLDRIAGITSLDRWIELWEKIAALRERTRNANMDRKQAVLGAFALIEAATHPGARGPSLRP